MALELLVRAEQPRAMNDVCAPGMVFLEVWSKLLISIVLPVPDWIHSVAFHACRAILGV